jgi:membrane protein required for beta-lactamase induction
LPGEISKLFEAWKAGDGAAGDEVIAMTYGELRRVAHAYPRRERHAHTLQTTALLDAYVRLLRKGPGSV